LSDTPYVGQQARSGNVRSVPVRAAIARAAQATGVDFNYLLAQAKLESSLDPSAKAGTSSAAGLYQFTSGTWLSTLDRHGAEHGLGWAGAAISGGRITDPAMRAQIMALRYDADASALMAGELAADNRAELATALGREPDAAELYLGHFLGVAGASTFLTALANDPTQSAARLMPQAAAANRNVFYGPEGARSVAGVMDHIRGRMGAAMEAGAPEMWATMGSTPQFAIAGTPATAIPAGGPIAREFHGGRAQMPQSAGRSMAETLNASFGAGTAAPAHVRDAYAKLARFGL
jgi:Transglycosylase SLT domain